jgi:hypothetical protein
VKKYKVALNTGAMSFVHASRYADEGKWTRFYRDDSVVAEFDTVSVRAVEEIPPVGSVTGGDDATLGGTSVGHTPEISR